MVHSQNVAITKCDYQITHLTLNIIYTLSFLFSLCLSLCLSLSFSVCLSVSLSEVVGAVISVLIIWLVTGVLVYEATLRIIHKDKSINADIMLITACISVFVNVL